MRTLVIFFVSAFIFISCSIESRNKHVKSDSGKSCNSLPIGAILETNDNEHEEDKLAISMLDLFYGMETDSCGNYCDLDLDTIPGLIHKEFSSIWYHPYDSIRFKMTMGLYIDECYPSDIVRNIIFKKVNEVIPEGFSYDIDEQQDLLLKAGVNPTLSTDKFISSWERLFNKISSMNGYDAQFASYQEVIGSRGCTVCHKVYEDSTWATYIVEISVDYHSSCGCPSSADYYTVNKSTGKLFTIDEFLEQTELSDTKKAIRKEYEKAAASKGFEANDYYTGDNLINEIDGIALFDEGVLIYFHPYKIGCGAEGQYNLIIPVRDKN